MKEILALVFIVAFLTFFVWWNVYRWRDCKMVGHSSFYCLMR